MWKPCFSFAPPGPPAVAARHRAKRDDPEDEGPYCYETTHVPEEEYDADNDPIMENLDNSDY